VVVAAGFGKAAGEASAGCAGGGGRHPDGHGQVRLVLGSGEEPGGGGGADGGGGGDW
jgi:hypothetical protein